MPLESPMMSVMASTSAEAMHRITEVLFADARSALDLTYGLGGFWKFPHPTIEVVGLDLDPARGLDLVADYRSTGLPDASFDLVAFDPPYISNPSHSGTSVMASRFGSFANVRELEESVRAGTREAWRLCRLGIVVKVQNHMHGGKFVHMTRWVMEEIPEPVYDEVHVLSNKLIDSKWTVQLSAWRNHSTYTIFRKGSQTHARSRSRSQ